LAKETPGDLEFNNKTSGSADIDRSPYSSSLHFVSRAKFPLQASLHCSSRARLRRC